MSFKNAGRALQQQLVLRADYTQRFPVIDAVLRGSEQNSFIRPEILNQMRSSGKKRKLVVNYYPPQCDAVGDCDTTACDAGDAIEPQQDILDITRCLASKNYILNIDDVRDIDGNYGFSDNAYMQILSTLTSLRKELATQIAAWLVANLGVHNDGHTSKAISFTDPSNAALRPLGLWEIEREFQDLGMRNPFIVGGSDVFTWMKAVQYGGLNNNGQQTGQLPTDNMFYDIIVDNAFGDPTKGHVIAFDPQMIKFVAYNKNAGIFATTQFETIQDLDRLFRESGEYIRGTFQDPVTTLLWDFNLKFDDCEERFTYNIKLHWDILMMPEYVCANQGVNGLFGYTTCLPAQPACPDVTPPSPVTPSEFDFDTSTINCFPLFVASLSLGGKNTAPNVSVANAAELTALLNSEIQGYVFTNDGDIISYTGYSAITGTINGGDVTLTFTAATT